ncbi:hypothetical protein [Streptomyces sp. NBC_00151]|uniref:hypothetical protein n=1 Tax=Streptomyces sp. NBC_00151 TaxID=2975669 RepID=UPI002DDAF069|nr:hypothetical protein [Streptomyces sp. NBC_00151]WRZ38037.1 hypothetical protein OG915_08215 [Streptomyces sp. NBC_00151]
MTSLIVLACGCLMAFLGTLTLSGRLGAHHSDPRKAGWGFILMGSAFVLDGLPRLVGWSYAVGSDLAGAAMILVVLGGLLQVLGGPALRAARLLTSLADTDKSELHRATANVSGWPAEEEQAPPLGDDDPRRT